jgi:hypothetical protein
MEPYRLRRWKRRSSSDAITFYTCARPGRSKSAHDNVPDDIVDKWVRGLPGDTQTTLVSLDSEKFSPS